MKQCSACKALKPQSEFYKNRSKKDGLATECASCCLVRVANYYERNKDRIAERVKAYALRNKDHISEYQSSYRESNFDYLATQKREWHKSNYQEDRGRILERNRLYWEKHPEIRRIASRRRNSLKNGVNENWSSVDELWLEGVFPFCCKCGSTDRLTVDHFRPLSKGFPLSRTNAIRLCGPCNSSKRAKMPEEFFTTQELSNIAYRLAIYGDIWPAMATQYEQMSGAVYA